MRYVCEALELDTTDVDEVLDTCCTEEYYEEDYEGLYEWLNNEYGSFNIGGHDYDASDIVKEFSDEENYIRDYAYRMRESDADQARWELEHAHIGATVWIQNNEIDVLDETELYDEDEPCDIKMDVECFLQEQKETAAQEQTQRIADENTRKDYFDLFQRLGE